MTITVIFNIYDMLYAITAWLLDLPKLLALNIVRSAFEKYGSEQLGSRATAPNSPEHNCSRDWRRHFERIMFSERCFVKNIIYKIIS